MEIKSRYSHLNGEEFLIVHHPQLLKDVREVVAEVDAEACRTKVSKEKTMRGKLLYSPEEMNRRFKEGFEVRGWKQRRATFWVTHNDKLLNNVYRLPEEKQKRAIEEAGYTPIMSYNQTDFVKGRVAVEVQFGKYAFVAHDLFVKHLSFYVSEIIDVGIEILPMKELEKEMSSGVPYYERDLLNVLRQGRGVPAVPLLLVGILP